MPRFKTATKIYNHFFGHLDDRHFKAKKTQEINDWLTEGDPSGMTLTNLCTEWAEYDAADIAQQRDQ